MLIFEEGLSTKDEVSKISGRGLGMGAIREAILGLGGKVAITLFPSGEDQERQAFSIDLYLPRHLSR